MGYYTIFIIKIVNKYNTRKNLEKLLDLILKISGYSAFDIVGSTITDFRNDGHKWYEWDHDMLGISRLLPKFEISVKGKGEEGETWEYAFKNGESYSYYSGEFEEPDEKTDFYDENELHSDSSDSDNSEKD